MEDRLVGVFEETTTGVKRRGFAAINVTDSKVYFLPFFPFYISRGLAH
jgi:hypothetical protein